MNSLKSRAINSIFWSAVENLGTQAVHFGLGLVLARLLMPSDYGLVGMLGIFIAIAQSLIEGGFTSALIRTKNPTSNDYSTVFWFNILISVSIYILFFIASPLIASFYKQEELGQLIKVISLSLVINSFGGVQRTILTKKLDFKSQAIISIISIIISGVIGIFMAYTGYGVWALVGQTIARAFFNTIGLWFFGTWRPLFAFSKKSLKELFNFGSKLLASGLLNTIFDNVYTLVIGKVYSAESLGYYTRAQQFQRLPVSATYGIMQRVTFPVLSELQDDDLRLSNAYRKFIRTVAFLIFPIMTLIGCLSFPIITILLTEKWISAAPMLQILVIIGATYPIHAINLNILNVKGRSDLFLRLEIIKKILISVVLVATFSFGIRAMLWGQVITSLFALYLNTYYTKGLINYGLVDQLRDLWKPFFYSLITGIIVIIFISIIQNQMVKLFGGLIIGFLVYFLLFITSTSEERKETLELLKLLKNKFNS